MTNNNSFTHQFLIHHGILGQKWGKRNGPPYPLSPRDHSASEKRAGWRKSIDKSSDKTDNKKHADSKDAVKDRKGLTSNQKKAVAIGATAAALALATYGAYRLGYLDDLQEKGKSLAGDVFDKLGNKSANPFKAIEEPLDDSLKNANPLRDTIDSRNNCTYSAVAGFLRTLGFDVTAKSTGGKMQNLGGILENCFKDVQVHDGSAKEFAKSPSAAAEMLRRRFGNNASGAVQIQWRGGSGKGHAFNWKITDGVVEFLDFQQGTSGSSVKSYWKDIDPKGSLQLARLDGLELNINAIKNCVNWR